MEKSFNINILNNTVKYTTLNKYKIIFINNKFREIQLQQHTKYLGCEPNNSYYIYRCFADEIIELDPHDEICNSKPTEPYWSCNNPFYNISDYGKICFDIILHILNDTTLVHNFDKKKCSCDIYSICKCFPYSCIFEIFDKISKYIKESVLENNNLELNIKELSTKLSNSNLDEINCMNFKLRIKINNLEEENRKLNILLLDIKSNATITENNLDEQFIITQKLREKNNNLEKELIEAKVKICNLTNYIKTTIFLAFIIYIYVLQN